MRVLIFTLLVLAGCSRMPISSEPLSHEVYVWQRLWTPALNRGLVRAAPVVARFDVLIGEIGMHQGTALTTLAHVDYPALSRTGKPVALALRIAAFAGVFNCDSAPLVEAKAIFQSALSKARSTGVEVAELQIDFDCPSARLAGYTIWVKALHAAFPRTPLTITALPDWLNQRDFPKLAAYAGQFILQVHSIPCQPGAVPALCDAAAARRAIAHASALGIPFRVALPTYSCELTVDDSGRIIHVCAEDSSSPPQGNVLVIRPDIAALAALVQEMSGRPPKNLRGIIWYRLPIDSDRLNWRWSTLAAIIAGHTPKPVGQITFSSSEPGVEDVVLENRGDADWALPAELPLPSETLAADGVNGYRVDLATSHSWKLCHPIGSVLSPGGRLVCGWIRREIPSAITAEKSF